MNDSELWVVPGGVRVVVEFDAALDFSLVPGALYTVPRGEVEGTLAVLEPLVEVAWVGTGGFTVTSTFEFRDELCQGTCPLFETSTSDDLSSNHESKLSDNVTRDQEPPER